MSGEQPSGQSDEVVASAAERAAWHLAAVVESSDDAIVSKGLDSIVQTWNPAAQRIFGYTAEEMIGKPITLLFPPDLVGEEAHILERISRGQRVHHYDTVRVRKDGKRINVSVTISPVRDGKGRIIGASKIARDVSLRKQEEQERDALLDSERAARAEAERLGRLKDEFLATLSHELRTPLQAVLGWSRLLMTGRVGEEEMQQALATIERNAVQQAQLIEDLLDMSRVISGKLRLEVRPVSMAEVVEAAVASARPAAEAKGVRIEQLVDPHAPAVMGDSARLQQVAWNLLSNAVKFTPRGGQVRVVMHREGSQIELVVSDTGQGIAPEFLPHVFDRFRQADPSTTRRHGGLGLGLSIVRHLVELHGGTVTAGSEGTGQGATFIVKLPVSVVRGTQALAEHAGGDAGAEAFAAERLKGIKVLVVDDEPDARALIARILGEFQADVVTAASASEALELVRSEQPSLLLSDIGMPDVDGYALLRSVRALPRDQGGDVPAVALTAFARPEDRRRALLGGFQMHLAKPIDPTELVAAVANLARLR
jgi:PAS domain S-box-containing protein